MGDALGGGVMVAVAATLWIAYLLPSWLNRRQYLATERNAVRLQQTLRILAETSETPEQVRLEATARVAASQERVLREREAGERARLKAEETVAATERRAVERAAAESVRRAKVAADAGRTRARAVRRTRGLVSLVLLGSLVALVAGVVTGIAGAAWTLALAGVGGTFAALFALSALAKAGRRVPAASVAVAPVAETAPFVPVEWADAAAPAAPSWTPQPLPKPLHLARGSVAATAMGSVEQAAALRRAAVFAAMSEKAAAMNEGVVPLRPAAPAAPVAPAAAASVVAARSTQADSRFASMGIVEESAPGMADLDAVLRRRRVG